MAITLDTTASGVWSSGTTLTFNITIGSGSDGAVGVSISYGTGGPVTAVSVGSLSLTSVRTDTDVFSSTIWQGVAPPTGSQTVTVTFTGTPTLGADATCVSLFGVDQTTPMDVAGGAGGNTGGSGSTTHSSSITTVTDGAALQDALGIGGSVTITMGAQTNRVERYNDGTGDPGAAASTLITKATAGAQTMDWTTSAARRGGRSIMAFRPAVSAAIDAMLTSGRLTSGLLTGGALVR